MIFLFLPAFAADLDVYEGDDLTTLSSALQPGDEIRIHKGIYPLGSNGLNWSGVGTEAEPIVVRGVEDGVILQQPEGWTMVTVEASTFLRIERIGFQGGEGWEEGGYSGLRILDSSDIVVKDCTFENIPGTAIALGNDNQRIRIEHNEFSSLHSSAISAGCGDASCWTQESIFVENLIHDLVTDYSDAIELQPGGQNNEIRDNVIYGVTRRGIKVQSTLSGDPNIVEGNAIWNTGEIGMMVRGAAIIRNNVIFNTGSYGIAAESSDSSVLLSGVVISSNTIVGSTDRAIDLNHWFSSDGSFGEGLVLANNAISNPLGYALRMRNGPTTDWPEGGPTLVGNVVTGLVEGVPGDLLTPGAGTWDFSDVEGWDFYPVPGSVLINAGDAGSKAWVPETDFNGLPREGDAPDAGAYEYFGEGNPGWALQETFKVTTDKLPNSGEDVSSGCCKDKGSEEALLYLPLLALGWRRRRHS